jgi:Sulfotransferase domain
MSSIKELGYFLEHRNWKRGVKWYQSFFRSEAAVRGEATPGYTMHPRFPGVPERMHALIPQARLIYLVRDPIERIVSEYMHYYAGGQETRSLEAVLLDSEAADRHIARSKYYYQIEQYLPLFPEENIRVFTTEDLGTRRQETLAAMFRFLGVDDRFSSRRFGRVKNPTDIKRRLNPTGRKIFLLSEKYINRYYPNVQRFIIRKLIFPFTTGIQTPDLSAETRARLAEELAPDVQKLRDFTGRKFSEWSI